MEREEEAMKKKLLILIISTLLPYSAWAGDFPNLNSTWQAERDAASVQVVRMWLSGAPRPLLQKEILRFMDREIKLSIISPDARLLVSDPQFDAQQIPISLLVVILRQNGIMLDPADFFAGKKFFVLAPQSGGRHAAK
jgi:hypothetical protein